MQMNDELFDNPSYYMATYQINKKMDKDIDLAAVVQSESGIPKRYVVVI